MFFASKANKLILFKRNILSTSRICHFSSIQRKKHARYIKECALYTNKSMHSRQMSVHGIKEGSESTI